MGILLFFIGGSSLLFFWVAFSLWQRAGRYRRLLDKAAGREHVLETPAAYYEAEERRLKRWALVIVIFAVLMPPAISVLLPVSLVASLLA